MKVWIMTWDTESGDEGVYNKAWRRKPTEAQQKAAARDAMSEDFEAGTLYWEIHHIAVPEPTGDCPSGKHKGICQCPYL